MNFYKQPIKTKGADPFEPIPYGESVETDWAAWEETVASENNQTVRLKAGEQTIAAIASMPLDWSLP
jgi:hypothetical protein